MLVMNAAAWRGTPWSRVDDPGELASIAADEAERAAKTAAPIPATKTPAATVFVAPARASLSELTAELNELRIRIEYADDKAVVELAQRISAVLHEMVEITRVAAVSVTARRAGGIYCPGCRDLTSVDSHTGRCLFCDEVVLGGTLRAPEAERHVGRSRGPDLVSMRVLRDAYDAYLTGLSLRRVAIAFLDQTGYSSVQSCANCLCDAWRGMGWPLRDRIAATRATSYRHGLARDPNHRARLRRATGEIRDVQCAAIKTRYGKGRGERCQRPAMLDGAYCHNHEPALRDQVHEHLARVRAARSTA